VFVLNFKPSKESYRNTSKAAPESSNLFHWNTKRKNRIALNAFIFLEPLKLSDCQIIKDLKLKTQHKVNKAPLPVPKSNT
jgi:hypothetical protein